MAATGCPLIQYAPRALLCERDFPFGAKSLCDSAPDLARAFRGYASPPSCRHATCAVVGSGGTLIGARLGRAIDRAEAVFRVNNAPIVHEGRDFGVDVGRRTTWRVMTMETYAYLPIYARNWLAPPRGRGTHATMAGATLGDATRYAVVCHEAGPGRCRRERLTQTLVGGRTHLIDPLLVRNTTKTLFPHVRGQRVPSTGMTALAFALRVCDRVDVYGFGNGTCGASCYHYYDCAHDEAHFFRSRGSRGYHNFAAQARVLQRLHARGRIRLHGGRCGIKMAHGHARGLAVEKADADTPPGGANPLLDRDG